MADIKQDLLSLQFSDSFALQGMQEANIDLQLPPAPTTLATVYGTVTDGTDPIPNATVKLFDSAGQAVAGCFVGLYQVVTVGDVTQEVLVAVTKTNTEGKYLFGGVTGGDYLVKAKLER